MHCGIHLEARRKSEWGFSALSGQALCHQSCGAHCKQDQKDSGIITHMAPDPEYISETPIPTPSYSGLRRART